MPSQAEMRAEELVYEVADEIGLTEDEVLALDAIAVAENVLRDLRVVLLMQVGRTLPHESSLPAESSSENLVLDIGLSGASPG